MSNTQWGSPEFDDRTLIIQIRAGNREAFLRLYEMTYATLLRFAYVIVQSRPVAEDAVQNTFASLWVRRRQWQPNGLVMPYLYRSVRNQIFDHLRHTHVVEQTERLADPDAGYGLGTPPPATDAELDRMDRASLVAAAIRRLPERQRTAVILRWHDEMTTAAIADVMNISRQAVEKLLRLAEERLRTLLRTLDTK